MAQKEFRFKGKSLQELQTMSITEFAELVPSGIRRTLLRGFTDEQKKLLERIRKNKNNIKTHCRDLPVLPEMVGKTLAVYTGKEFFKIMIVEEMLGHVLGEFALSRRRVAHNAPGVGATKSSASVSVR